VPLQRGFDGLAGAVLMVPSLGSVRGGSALNEPHGDYGLACDRYVGQTAGVPQIADDLLQRPRSAAMGQLLTHAVQQA
jgi:hypothetical protein